MPTFIVECWRVTREICTVEQNAKDARQARRRCVEQLADMSIGRYEHEACEWEQDGPMQFGLGKIERANPVT